MSAIASRSVKCPHQPVEIVHKPKPTSADHEIGIFVSTKPHSVMFTAEFAEVTDEITISISWIRILRGEIHA